MNVIYTVRIEPEDIPIHGYYSSDEPELDRELESEISARLDRGDIWAWCWVEVTASCGEFTASDSLGCCSFAGRSDFEECYGADMRGVALDALLSTIERASYRRAAAFIDVVVS